MDISIEPPAAARRRGPARYRPAAGRLTASRPLTVASWALRPASRRTR